VKVIVCGGRDYADRRTIFTMLDRLHAEARITLLAHGDAPNCDRIAGQWAKARGVQRVAIPANWEGEGDKAGSIRNRLMHDLIGPERVIAFPGGRGTANMMRIAHDAGTELIDIEDLLDVA
jgi:hypothetical protein